MRSTTRRVATLLAATLTLSTAALAVTPLGRAAGTVQQVSSDRETDPGAHAGDSMDDPAIWVNPTSPDRSLVLVNDKAGSLNSYDLDGHLVQRVTTAGSWGNVDVRQDVTIAGTRHQLVGAVQDKVRFYDVDPSTLRLSPTTEGATAIGPSGEGFCLYQSPTSHLVYGFSLTRSGEVRQFELTDADHDGLLSAQAVRSFDVGSEAEGCVADDRTGALYVSQEDRALWHYQAESSGGAQRTSVDVLQSAGGHLVSDIEGVTLVDRPDGSGSLIASAQNVAAPGSSYFAVYRRDAGNDFVKTFRVVDGTVSDDCDRTDGVAATADPLGSAFPHGLFVCQDNNNDAPGSQGDQDVKLVRLEKVLG